MKPSLSIGYGGAPNGSLGVGFRLSGFSVIAPCSKTLATEGIVDGVNFNRDDAYCLEGQTLITNQNIGPEVEFHTESETFQKIVAYYTNASDKQPASFKVWGRDAIIRTYEPLTATQLQGVSESGVTKGSKQVAIVFPIRSATDRTGNRVKYNYEVGADSLNNVEFSYRPSSIQYSFSSSSSNPRRWVSFHYGPRTDTITKNAFGVQSVTRSLLTEIEAFAPNPTITQSVWRYELAYQPSIHSRRSLLKSVRLCDQTGMCSYAKKFEYSEAYAGIGDHVVSDSVEFSQASLSQDTLAYFTYESKKHKNFLEPTDVRLVIFDANGDGVDDGLYRTAATRYNISQDTKSEGYYYTVSTTVGYEAGKIMLRLSAQGDPLSTPSDVTGLFEPYNWQVNLGKTRVGDFAPNGTPDGIPDLLLARTRVDLVGSWATPNETIENVHKWYYGYTYLYGYPWSGSTTQDVSIFGPIFRGPFIVSDVPFFKVQLFDPPFQRTVADVNGDGQVDQIEAFTNVNLQGHLDQDWGHIKSYNNPWPYVGYKAPSSAIAPFPHYWTCGNGNMRISDLDGDGREDILATRDDYVPSDSQAADVGVYKRMYIADDGTPQADDAWNAWGGDCGANVPDLVLADFNGDGLDDVLYPPKSINGNPEPMVRWNLGNGFGPLLTMPVIQGGTLNDRMYQAVPVGKDGVAVGWDRGTRTADLNGDGRQDIVAFRLEGKDCFDWNLHFGCGSLKTTAIAYLSTGDGFDAEIIQEWEHGAISLAHGFTLSQVGDVTGDGAPDIINVVDGKIHVLELRWRDQPDRLLSVWDEGVYYPLEYFQYSRAWWGDGPKPIPTDCAYPMSCMRRGSTVVQQHASFMGTRADGKAMYHTNIHTFTDPRSDLRGRGFLGFGSHHVWDVGLGQETITVFDNKTRQDLNGAAPGGVFYPFAGVPISVTTITPVAPLPTQAQLDAPGLMPGLNNAVPLARVTQVNRQYAVTSRLDGRVLLVQPKSFEATERETAAMVTASNTPGYAWWNVDVQPLRQRSGTTKYDDFGNVKYSMTTTEGGVRRVTTASYDNREADWLLGLQTEGRTLAYTEGETVAQPRIVHTTYDPHGLVTKIEMSAAQAPSPSCGGTDPSESAPCPDLKTVSTTFDRNSRGVVTKVTAVAEDEAVARVVRYYYDSEFVYRDQMRDSLGHLVTTLHHPALGTPLLYIDANGVVTNTKYDGFGRVAQINAAGTAQIDITYAGWFSGKRRGMLVGRSAQDGSGSSVIQDELGRTIRSTRLGFDGLSIASSIEYDEFGNAKRVSRPGVPDPSSSHYEYTYDRLGRGLGHTTADGKTTPIKHTMFSSDSVDPEGHNAYVVRDKDGRVIESGNIVKGEKYGEVKLHYGSFDQVTTITDAQGNVTTIQYDNTGRRRSLSDPDAGTSTFHYNGFGERLGETDELGKSTTYEYDAIGRLVNTVSPDGPTTFVWDSGPHAVGQLVSTTSPDQVVTHNTYDSLGRLEETTRTIGGANGTAYSVKRAYDNYGRVEHIFYPEIAGRARFTVAYGYNNKGYMKVVRDVTKCPKFGRKCIGRELWRVNERNADLAWTEGIFANGLEASRIYEETTGRVSDVRVSQAGFWLAYGYNSDGLLSSRIDMYTGRTEGFDYDHVHRLAGWKLQLGSGPVIGPTGGSGNYDPGPEVPTGYKYDELGNLLTITRDGTVEFKGTYDVPGKPHALGSTSTEGTFAYDARGRQISGGGRDLITYASFGLPLEISTPSETTDFAYDAFGARVQRKSVKAATETISISELYQKRTSPSGDLHVFYVTADEGLVAQFDYDSAANSEETLYYVTDPLGSAAIVLDETGNALERPYHDPFGHRTDVDGEPVDASDPRVTVGFTGHEHDDDLGLINMRGRFYDPDQRRFISPDPLVSDALFGQSYNPYSYALNNPTNYTDRSGYEPQVHTNSRGETYTVDADGIYHWSGPAMEVTACGNPAGCDHLKKKEPDLGEPQLGGIRADGDTVASHASPRLGASSNSDSLFSIQYRPEFGDAFPYQTSIRSDATTIDFVENFAKDVYNIGALLGNTLGRVGWTIDRGITGAVHALGGSPSDADAVKIYLAAPEMLGAVSLSEMVAGASAYNSTRAVVGDMVSPALRSVLSNRKWYGVRNAAGGRVWVSRRPTNAGEVAALVRELQAGGATEIKVLTGTHGTTLGHLEGEYRFFLEDLASFASDTGVQVHEIVSSSGAPYNISGLVNSQGEIVAAFCYSERSVHILQSISPP